MMTKYSDHLRSNVLVRNNHPVIFVEMKIYTMIQPRCITNKLNKFSYRLQICKITTKTTTVTTKTQIAEYKMACQEFY